MTAKAAKAKKTSKKTARKGAVKLVKKETAGKATPATGYIRKKRKGGTLTELAPETQLNPITLIEIIRKGVDYSIVERLRGGLDLSTGEIGELIDITPRTLSRRKKEGRLAKDESERAVRIGRLWNKALDVFDGDGDRAQRWFKTPAFSLDDKTPLEFSDTEPGAQEVFNLLGRIEHGLGA